LQGITGHELCHYFWDPSVRMEWEITLETSNVVSWLARDTHITYQALKRIWPTAQRDSLFWSTIRHCPSDDDDGPDYWIVVNHTTDCMPVSQVCVHCVPKNVHLLIFWITLSKLVNFADFWYHENLTDLSTLRVVCDHFTLENPKKSFSAVLFIHTSDYLRYLSRKQTSLLAHRTWKCHHTNSWKAKLFRLTEGLLHSFKRWRLWR